VSQASSCPTPAASSRAPLVTIHDLPDDALGLVLKKTLHSSYPGAVWTSKLHSAITEARWFLMDGKNQSHRVLDKFPHEPSPATVPTALCMRAALVCKRWHRIMYGDLGPGVVEHVAICDSRMPLRLPRTVRTLFIHGQSTDWFWRLTAHSGTHQRLH
jgi:hypothetical protein